jgi:Protein of unknown function DUF262.
MHKYTETTNRSIAWLKKANDQGQLEMRPPFQRNPVWSLKQKGALVETILLEYPVPEIYMQDVVDENGGETHIVVDGQQRIRAVLEYVAGEFEIAEEGSRWEGLYFEDLSADDKRKIFEYKFVTRTLPEMPDEQIRAIFQRINRNTVVLNAQELRHATYWGAFIKLMEEISDFGHWTDLNIFSPNDRRRMLDTEFVSELAVAYLNGIQNKKTKLEEYYQIYEVEFDEADRVRSIFNIVLGELMQIFPDLGKTRFRKKSDFYTLFLVLAEKVAEFPLDKEARERLSNALRSFADTIDKVISGATNGVSAPYLEYARNVERAASDLGSRRARHAVLKGVVEHALSPEAFPETSEIQLELEGTESESANR